MFCFGGGRGCFTSVRYMLAYCLFLTYRRGTLNAEIMKFAEKQNHLDSVKLMIQILSCKSSFVAVVLLPRCLAKKSDSYFSPLWHSSS